MGTTITTNLGLIKPDVSEKIKEDLPSFPGWAAQNSDNCDVIDGLFRNSTDTYTPAWTGAAGNPVLGAGGFIEGKYIRLFPRIVIGFFRIFTGGAGFSAGSGTYRLSVPATMDTSLDSFADTVPVGKAAIYDDSAVINCSNMLVTYNGATDLLNLRVSSGGSWTTTSPITLAQNDRISGYFMYPTSDA